MAADSSQVVIKRNPEHATLAEYLADNGTLAYPIVGLDNITEFWPLAGVCNDLGKRPFYHCSVGECYNEQGNSRQMMQHLVRKHHAEGWLKDKRLSVPDSFEGMMARCKEIMGNKVSGIRDLKVIVNEDLWFKCKKARLRLNKKEASDLHKVNLKPATSPVESLNATNIVGDLIPGGKSSSQNTTSSDIADSEQHTELSNDKVNETSDTLQDLLINQNLTDTASDDNLVIVESSEPLPSPMELVVSTPNLNKKVLENCEDNTVLSDTSNDNRTELSGKTPPQGSINELGPYTHTVTDTNFEGVRRKTLFSPVREESSDHSNLETENIEMPRHKKLSLREYQEKLKKDKSNELENPDLKPFCDDDDEIEVVGYKEGNIKSKADKSSRSPVTEPIVKKEKPSGHQPRDLLERRSSGDVLVECTVKAQPQPKTDPKTILKYKVTDKVKKCLLNFYAKDAKDKFDKHNNPKVIKIKSQKEFEKHCRTFSKKFCEEILDAYVSFNGGTEGIETVNVDQYGVDHDIEKFFSDR